MITILIPMKMKYSHLLFICFLMIIGGTATGFRGGEVSKNILTGRIVLPDENSGLRIVQGKRYQPQGPLSARKKEIDRQNHSDRHMIVSLHPLDFDAGPPTPTSDVIITQQEKTFIPKVVAVTPGSSIAFLNEDIEIHNVQCLTPRAKFSKGRRSPGVTVRQTVNKVGKLKVTCDIHKEMLAYVLCFDTPYYQKAGPEGHYRLEGLPDGRYLLKVFHYDLGERQEEVEISGGGLQKKDIYLYVTQP